MSSSSTSLVVLCLGLLALAAAANFPERDEERGHLPLPAHVGWVADDAGASEPGSARDGARLPEAESLRDAHISAYAEQYGIGERLSTQIYEAARAEGVNAGVAFSLVRVESGFDPRALGPRGAIGLTQIHPRTARELSPGLLPSELYAPRLNLRLGFRYFRLLLDRFDDDALALTAYNRGPNQVEELLSRGRDPRNGYARRILRAVEQASGAAL